MSTDAANWMRLKSWRGGAKVIDEQLKPLVCFIGSIREFICLHWHTQQDGSTRYISTCPRWAVCVCVCVCAEETADF